jgi:hypothetical protein
MKGLDMTTDWRTVQLFLDDNGVAEVEADVDDYQNMRCTCNLFRKSLKKCRHTTYIKKVIEKNGGAYSIKLPEDLPDEELDAAMESKESFRALLIKYAPIEVL